MNTARIRLTLLALVCAAHTISAHAGTEILHEVEPIYLAGCPLSTTSLMTPTTLAAHDHAPFIYQGGVMRTSLSGNLIKLKQAGPLAGKLWDASALLAQRASPRQVWTADQHGNLIPLDWNELDDARRALLDRSPSTQLSDGLGERRLRYLLGDRVDESGSGSGIFPHRDGILGAVVQSVPLRVGAPASGLQSPDYLAFLNTHRERRAVVYLGAADGMLHAFDDETGEELFAVVPHALFDKLPLLTAGPRFGILAVDGGMAAADVRTGTQWRTVLVAGIGRGAQGVLALDVSDPERFGRGDHLLWEFTDRDDPDVGDVIGSPVIARFRTGMRDGVMQYAYFAMIASGLNNDRADGEGRQSVSGANTLFLLSLDKSASAPWQSGVNYFKFAAPAGDRLRPNGMIELTAVVGVDNAVERAYAGDLQGNLWRFDFSEDLPWGKPKGKAPHLLFVAQDDLARRQAIMHKPALVFAPGGGYVVLFGTGRYLNRGDLDKTAFAVQSFYAVLDRDNPGLTQRGDLVGRQLTTTNAGGSLQMQGEAFVYGTSGNGRRGWLVDFPDAASSGERVVAPLSLVGSHLVFHSLSPSASACQAPAATLYVLETLTGMSVNVRGADAQISTDVPGATLIRTSAGREKIKPDGSGKRQFSRMVEIVRGDGSAIAIELPASASSTAGRLSWRELVNWSEQRRTGKGMAQP